MKLEEHDTARYEPSTKRQRLDNLNISGNQSQDELNFYSEFSIYGKNNYEKMRKSQLDGPTSSFHSRLMAALHPKLKYNDKLD